MKLTPFNIFLFCSLSIGSTHLCAQSQANSSQEEITSNDNRTVYPASFFEQYSPQNALDMIERIPGFSFNEGSDDRGFGGNAGNVLINGARPTSKSSGLEGALERISVSQVLQIEVIRGGVSASDSGGQTVIANVIKNDTQTSGTWSFLTMRTKDGTFKPQFEGSLATKLGAWETSFNGEVGGVPGYRPARIEERDAQENVTSQSNETLKELEEYININGEAAREFKSGKLTLNASISGEKEQDEIKREIYNAPLTSINAPDEFEDINDEEKQIAYEVSIDWLTSLENWKLQMIGLASLQDTDYESNYALLDQNYNPIKTKAYNQENQETEYIFRTSFAKLTQQALKPEFGFEVAKNKLENDNEYIKNGIKEALEGVDSVEELRGEIFANFVYQYTPAISLEGGLTAEFSQIEAHSENTNSQNFTFIKPRLALNYQLDQDSTLVFEVLHEVEQLDFTDFAASSDSSDDKTSSGNNDLQPEQVSQFSVFYDLRFSERGSFDVEYYYEKRKDIHEEIFLPSGNVGLGNAGDATFWGVKTNMNIPLDYMLEGGLLDIEHSYKNSDFDDPIINDSRTIYNYAPNYLEVRLRQDLPQHKISWGIEYKSDYRKTQYYVDEKQTEEANHRLDSIFIETTRFFGMKTKLKVKDVNVRRYERTRLFYEDDRSGDYLGSEVANRKRELQVLVTLSDTF